MTLQEHSKQISENVRLWETEIEERKKDIAREIELTTEDLKEASAKGDRRENAEFTDALERLSQLNIQLSNIDMQSKELRALDESEEYEPIGLVIPFATCRLCVAGEVFVLKLYSGNISDISKGVLAQNSPVGQAIWLKPAGATVAVEHRLTGEPVIYNIEEIY